jgi:hypothetical protein
MPQGSGPKIRNIEATDREVSKYLGKLEKFLGVQNVEQRIKRVERTLEIETGLIYKRFWLDRQLEWWLGFRDARRVRSAGKVFHASGRVTPQMRKCLDTAVQLAHLYNEMPQSKRDEFKQRLLANGSIIPVLTEIDTAAHFWQLGYDIEWIKAGAKSGTRSPEFLASRERTKIEVECKSKTIDAGRMVISQHFYRLADVISKPCTAKKLMGEISITVQKRIPKSSDWRKCLISSLQSHLQEGEYQFELPDKTEIKTNLQKFDNTEIASDHIRQKAEALHVGYPYLAFISSQPRDAYVNMLYIRASSKNHDQILLDIFDDINDAKKQFSGSYAALIVCFIPEIDSFQRLREYDSGLAIMTNKFFSEHANDFINAVSYFSDEQVESIDAEVLSSSFPTVIFRNQGYNEKYGVNIPLLRSHLNTDCT